MELEILGEEESEMEDDDTEPDVGDTVGALEEENVVGVLGERDVVEVLQEEDEWRREKERTADGSTKKGKGGGGWGGEKPRGRKNQKSSGK